MSPVMPEVVVALSRFPILLANSQRGRAVSFPEMRSTTVQGNREGHPRSSVEFASNITYLSTLAFSGGVASSFDEQVAMDPRQVLILELRQGYVATVTGHPYRLASWSE